MQEAPIFKLGWKDLRKGIITAVLTGAVSALIPVFVPGTVITAAIFQTAGYGAIAGLFGYLLKNFGTNSEDKFLTKEPK